MKAAILAALLFVAPLAWGQTILSGSTTSKVTITNQTRPLTILDVYNATALLYSQTEDGGMKMRCTTTAYAHDKDTYHFVSAAHCVGMDDTDHERVQVDRVPFFITFDTNGERKFYSAKLVAAGYQHRGDDFSIFTVESKDSWPTVPLGDERDESLGAEIINVASPLGLGKQAFHGYISSPFLDRPVTDGDINWAGTMLLQLNVGPGSSGSAIISVKQAAIIGFLVGTVSENDTPNVVAMPVSRMKKFMSDIAAKQYKWYQPDAQ
jgi:hypothetical protein